MDECEEVYGNAHAVWRIIIDDNEILSPTYRYEPHQLSSFLYYLYFGQAESVESDNLPQIKVYHSKYRLVADLLVQHLVDISFNPNIVSGRSVALLKSGKRALVPADTQIGDIIFGARNEPGLSPSYVARPATHTSLEEGQSYEKRVFSEVNTFLKEKPPGLYAEPDRYAIHVETRQNFREALQGGIMLGYKLVGESIIDSLEASQPKASAQPRRADLVVLALD